MKTFFFFSAFFGFIFGIFFFIKLPFQNELSSTESIKYFNKDGEVFYEDFIEDSGYHEFVSQEKIPDFVKDATQLLEDKRFFYTPGFDPLAIIRAGIQNKQNGKIISGGSGLTQQLIRNHLKPQKRDVFYKIKELILAIKTTVLYSKQDILEAYLNSVYYGENAYGIGSASRIFFNKTPNELNVREAIFLAGLPQSPSVYSPFKKLQNALKREQTVIKVLEKNGFFQKYCPQKQCLAEPLAFEKGEEKRIAPHYIQETNKEFQSIFPNLEKKHIEIYTYFDQGLFEKTETILKNHQKELEEKNIGNAAVVVLNHGNKGVSTLLGSIDYFNPKIQGYVNNAVSLRQAGSTMKPFTYALAFEQGDTPDSKVDDSFIRLQTENGLPYEPKNYDFKEYGEVSYRQALANSYNISAIKIAAKVGVKNLLNTFRALGFHLPEDANHYGVAITLGDGDIRLFDLTSAYTVFPFEGEKFPFRFIQKIKVDGKVVYERPQEKSAHIFSARSANFIADILSDNQARSQQFGTNSPLLTSTWSAAKTGTTRNYRDNWTIGFTKQNTVGVWVGNSNGDPLKNSSGITGAAPLWHDVIESLGESQLINEKLKVKSLKSKTQKIEGNSENIPKKQEQKLSSIILSPQNGDTFLLEGSNQESIFFKAKKSVEWKLNGKVFGTGEKLFWNNPTKGIHCIEAEKEQKCFKVE